MNQEKLNKLKQKFGNVRTGGKGSVRRRRKVTKKTGAQDDKKLKSALNRLQVRDIPAIEVVNLFREDGGVTQFVNPKVQASIPANTYVVTGTPEDKTLQDVMKNSYLELMMSAGSDPKRMQQFAELLQSVNPKSETGDDDDIPDLVGDTNFEDVANETQ